MQSALGAIMAGQCTEVEIAAFLAALRVKGETAEELAAGARLLRDQATPLNVGSLDVLDTCGTGGDGTGTFNVSTAAALLAAACGIPVVKHGNRAVSSASGSADVLAALGIPIDLTPAELSETLSRTGFAFCFAPRFHPAMKHVANVRRALRFRTLFNLLGPLANPAGVRRQVIGIADRTYLERVAEALAELGSERALVVSSDDGMDELSTSAGSQVAEVTPDGIHHWRFEPADLQIVPAPPGSLGGGDPVTNAGIIRRVLDGEPGPRADVVALNAAAALLVSGVVETMSEGYDMARWSIESGKAAERLDEFAGVSVEVAA